MRDRCLACSCRPCCSRDEGGDDVGGVPVETAAGPVVSHCGSRVSVTGCLLHITQRDSRIKRGSDERMPEAMG